jgi:pimeloyl-ACP methyl ester carboxylesterase
LHHNRVHETTNASDLLSQKLKTPVLAVYGALSNTSPGVETMMHEVAETVIGLRIPEAAHWIAEEHPGAFTAGLLKFVEMEHQS